MSPPYQKSRFLAFLNPEENPEGAGFMYLKAKELITGGRWLGNTTAQQSIPEMSTDFAFAAITYYYGWITAGILVLVLSLLLARMIFVSGKIKDLFGKQLLIGVSVLFSSQFIYNVGMMLGLFPLISVSLSFISYGLTSAVLNSFIVGVALSVYRRKGFVAARKEIR